MAIRLPGVVSAKHILPRATPTSNKRASTSSDVVPEGFIAVYVGESETKRFVVPLSFLNQPLFQDLVSVAEQEFGFNHPMSGLTIPCHEDMFNDITSRLDTKNSQ